MMEPDIDQLATTADREMSQIDRYQCQSPAWTCALGLRGGVYVEVVIDSVIVMRTLSPG